MVNNKSTIRTIALEEHFVTPSFMEGPGRLIKAQAEAAHAHPQVAAGIAKLIEMLSDIGGGRIAQMDAAGIDMQVLSLTSPGVEQLDAVEAVTLAREVNDILADAVQQYPHRFAGFAALPISSPDKAANELERMVRVHGFKGALINGHTQGRYLDDEYFWPILERAETLQVPVYLHPTPPAQSVIKEVYTGNYSPEIAGVLATAAWGWHIDTANHVLRLILSGAFDRYPTLQVIVGHLGETLPFMLPRLERSLPPEMTKLKKSVGAYLRENVYYTVSGFNWTPAFLDLFLQVGVERIMFSTDYPYSSMHEARAFLDQLPVSPADRARIAHRNAEQLLKI
ncbi:amidohydrolase family protein [Paenibacillus sp. SC116]|uniref:amidohydrolase family protein n=1 Tax=Paenibacillus sp. SC116 TaxID=2968986 RepID=UPI00215AFB3E|nr:amidohydrolase family protein [Paenibacillus sp. SC116]MCR8842306.1 amidohydrolase family protein [Paenibacillus sp. SC116]